MKFTACILLSLCFLSLQSNCQDSITSRMDSITSRIVLVGDAGELTNGRHPVASAIKRLVPMDEKTTIIYLGDNLYETGLPDQQYSTYSAARAVLDSQLFIADSTAAKIYMVPGNHDWRNGRSDGFDAVVREQRYVDGLGRPNVKYYPKDGCPGPEEVQLGPNVWAILFDSQWWLHTFTKPGIESDCACKTQEEVVTLMQDILERHAKDLVLICCHHPFISNGVHGGFFKLKQHLFPFTDILPSLYIPMPLLGSIYPIARGVFGTPQDLNHPNYVNMVTRIREVTKDRRNVIFTAGHEHTLQLIKDSSHNYIVSGGGCKHQRVSSSKKSPYVSSENGFAVLEISTNKNVRCTFYEVTDSVHVGYSDNIFNFSTVSDPIADSINRIVENPDLKYQDTITISAGGDKYTAHSSWKKIFMGENYRKEWATPVNMKVFNISKEKGGFKIVSFGGGKATRTLTLRDTANKLWVLRSIDKDPVKAIPQNFRATLAADLVRDFISASQPYAPLTIPTLSEPLGLIVPKPELFFVPDDRAFGLYQRLFAKTICFLEEREPTFNNEKVMNSIEVFDKILDESDHRTDQPLTLQARLLDMLVADFDRHFGQWKWARGDTGKGKLFYPIPRDRDQALFYSDGLILKVVSQQLMPFLKGFRHNIPDVEWLNESAKDFDRVFLTDLDAHDWQTGIKELQEKLNDSVITTAVRKMPPEIYALDGATLTEKLISRRNMLSSAAMKYYRFLSKNVNVIGSNQKEYFKVSNTPGGLNVRVYGRKGRNDTSFIMYDRTFDQRVTKEIRLYGLGNDDLFDFDKNVATHIRFRVIGGTGNDTFNINGRVQNYLYDLDEEGNYIQHKSHSRNLFSKEPPVNYYNILGFKYNRTSYPGFTMAVNTDDGLMVGLGFTRRIYGFRNEPYASLQKFAALYSITRGGRQIKYDGEFNHAIRNYDVNIHAELMVPGISNFFGLGNKTKLDPNRPISFYRSRFSHFEGEFLFQKRLNNVVRFMLGPVFYHYWINAKDNVGKSLGNPSVVGLDSASVYSKKSYLGGKLAIVVDNLNNELFPTRGVQWKTQLTTMSGVSNTSRTITTLRSDMAVYASLADPAKLIAVIQLGAGRIYGDHYEYFQALTLGANNTLRGFSKNRFAGRSIAYGSLELRQKLVDVKSYVLPGALGLIGFAETGRVWIKNESSALWHNTFGGGFYYIPFNMALVSATIGFSKEQNLFNVSFGTKLNVSF